jgi:molecular chaperone GrpE
LEQAAESAPANGETANLPAVDLHALIGQFVALRHEVHLQTKATRAQQEQNADTLQQLEQALDVLKEATEERDADDEPSEKEQLRPLLKTLVDLYDALALARGEIERVQGTLGRVKQAAAAPPSPGWWERLWGKASLAHTNQDVLERVSQLLQSVVAGYTMSLERIDRALQQHGLEAMACLGTPFDPDRMEVVEAVAESGKSPGEVVKEVRRGYLWDGRVFRYAQVCVARNQSQ